MTWLYNTTDFERVPINFWKVIKIQIGQNTPILIHLKSLTKFFLYLSYQKVIVFMNTFDFQLTLHIFSPIILRYEISNENHFTLLRNTQRNQLKRVYCHTMIITIRTLYHILKLTKTSIGQKTVISLQISHPTSSCYLLNCVPLLPLDRISCRLVQNPIQIFMQLIQQLT